MEAKKNPLSLALLVMAAVILACGQIVTTPTPAADPPTSSPSAPPPTLTAAPTRTQPATTEAGDTATVRAALVNVRAEPNGEVVGQLTAGTDVRVIECDADWCEIEAEGVTGYIFVGCLSIADGKGCVAK